MPSDTNRVAMLYSKETSYGVLPGTANFQTLRYTSESFKQDTDSTQSQEIRADRAVADIIRTGVSASGEIGFELSYGTYNDLMAAVLGDADTAFSAIHTLSALTTISASAVDNSFNDTANSFTVGNGYVAGAWIKVSGFAGGSAANNNRVWKIRSRSSDAKIIVEGGIVVTDTAGDPVTIVRGGNIRTGTTLATYTIEKQFTDLVNNFEYIKGVAFDRMSLEITPDGIITGSFTTLGKRAESGAITLITGATGAATTTPVMNGIDNVLLIMEGFEGAFAAPSLTITGFSFEIGNNLRTRLEVGTLGAVSLGTGTHDVTGTVSFYYPDAANVMLDKYLNWTASSFAIVVGESASSNNVYVFDFPQVRYTDGSRNATGINDDVMVDLSFQAYLDATLGYTMQIVKFT